jgi:hypothetical protein
VSIGSSKIYHSALEIQPWFQIKFEESKAVLGVTYINRKDSSGERFQNVAVRVGDDPAVTGAVFTNDICAIFAGPSATGNTEEIMCTEPMVGRYLQVQMEDTYDQYLHINEIIVIFGNSSCCDT